MAVMWKCNCVCLILVISALTTISGERYKEKMQKHAVQPDSLKKDRPFRTNKINLVWEKGMKRLKPSEIKNFMDDLKLQDKLEMELKKRKMENADDDGEYEALVRSKLLDITHRYNLDNSWLDGSNKIDEKLRKKHNDKDDHAKAMKMDKKLDKLWKKAQAAGFDNYELDQLQQEFSHHKQKIDEFNQLKNEIDALEGLSDNSIQQFKNKDRKSISNDLKQKHRDIKESFDYLQTLVSKDGANKVEFSESKVIELWLLAKKANFSEVELESLKGELHHFEAKVKKHEHFKEQLTLVESQPGNKKKNLNTSHMDGKHSEIKQKTAELAKRVKKYHTELKNRIMSNIHTEL